MAFKKNTAVTGFGIGHFINASTGAAVTTGTPTCKRTIDGTGGACANAAAYNANGAVWEIDLADTDMNGDVIILSFTLTDCLPIAYTICTVTKLVSELNDAAALTDYQQRAVAVTLPTIPNDWIAAAGVKADAVTKIQAGLSTYAGADTAGTTTLLDRIPQIIAMAQVGGTGAYYVEALTNSGTAIGTSTLDAAGIRTAVGMANADLDTQLAALPTGSENATAVLALFDSEGVTEEVA